MYATKETKQSTSRQNRIFFTDALITVIQELHVREIGIYRYQNLQITRIHQHILEPWSDDALHSDSLNL